MTIRRAKLTDYKALIPLLNDFVGEDRYSRCGDDSFKKVLKSKDNYIYVAQLPKTGIIGFATFSVRLVVRYPRPIAELDELYVAPAFRRQGIATKLLNTIIVKAKKLSCHRIYIGSGLKRQSAHKLYEKNGFIVHGYHFVKNL